MLYDKLKNICIIVTSYLFITTIIVRSLLHFSTKQNFFFPGIRNVFMVLKEINVHRDANIFPDNDAYIFLNFLTAELFYVFIGFSSLNSVSQINECLT